MIDRNKIFNTKIKIEHLYWLLKDRHQELLNLIEDCDCIDDEKSDDFYSILKEYESEVEKIESILISLKSQNTKIESLFSEVKLLKKKRLTKIESKISKYENVEFNEDLIVYNEDCDEDTEEDLPF